MIPCCASNFKWIGLTVLQIWPLQDFDILAAKCLIRAYFCGFWEFWPLKLWYRCSNPKGMQLSQKHAFWGITRQNRSSGLVPSCAKEQIKKHRPSIFHPFVGSRPWTDWHAIWRSEWHPRPDHPCQILFKSVKGFLGGSNPKMAISYTFSNDPYNSIAPPYRLRKAVSCSELIYQKELLIELLIFGTANCLML